MTKHQPVMLEEVIDYLKIEKGAWYLDATFGGGGHSLAILKAGGNLIALDWDKENIEIGRKRLVTACPSGVSYHLYHLNYCQLDEALEKTQVQELKGALFDLGFSTDQLYRQRGFSFHYPDEVLDLRYDSRSGRPAWQVLRESNEEEIQESLEVYSQQPRAAEMASRLCRLAREKKVTVGDVIRVVEEVGFKNRPQRIHPATKVIQALRILVNGELDNLRCGLAKAADALSEGGRLVVISFHSGEDRIVKEFIRRRQDLISVTKKAEQPTKEEISQNPRSRSARLRVAEKKGGNNG